MKISKLHVDHFRSIFDETLPCEALTVLVGRNGAGKSSFLQALRLYLDPGANVSTEDFYNRDATKEIVIEVTFVGLTAEEQDEFRSSLLDSGELVVQRKFPSGQYYGRAFGSRQLEPIREKLRQKVKVGEVATELKKIVESGEFPGLKAVTTKLEEELDRWEKDNPARCEFYFRSGIFQGPTNIAGGKLRARTHFVYIPPVREAEIDASGSAKQSPLGTLVAPLVSAVTEKNLEVAAAKADVVTRYGTYRSLVTGAPERANLEADLTKLLQRYDAEAAAKIHLSLEEALNLPNPKPKVLLVEDGFEGDVAKKGHGLQRLFIFTILELYEKFRATGGAVDGTIVLAIEEPELYQHPARSRALARTLRDLCYPKEGEGFQFQIFFTTHSPYFVDLEHFQSLRRVEKAPRPNAPMESKVKLTTLKDVGAEVTKVYSKPVDVTEKSTWARIKSVLGLKASEGFFADAVILVEGQEDEAILTAYAEHKKLSLDSQGVSIISAEGKTNVAPLLVLYSQLGIRTFVIFDGDGNEKKDEDAHTDTNKALLALLGQTAQERPKSAVYENGAVWENNFVDTIKSEVGETIWTDSYAKACKEYSMRADEGRKKFAVIRRTMCIVIESGKNSSSLDRIWSAIESRCHLA